MAPAADAGIRLDANTPVDMMGFENPRVMTLAETLDMVCAADCGRDIACNPAQAPTLDACRTMYCDYVACFRDAEESEAILECLNADLALSRCIVDLNCEEYTRYYYSDDENLPCAEIQATYDAACDGFVD